MRVCGVKIYFYTVDVSFVFAAESNSQIEIIKVLTFLPDLKKSLMPDEMRLL